MPGMKYCPVMWGLFHKTIIRIPIKQPGFPMESKGPTPVLFFSWLSGFMKETSPSDIPSWLAQNVGLTQVISKNTDILHSGKLT